MPVVSSPQVDEVSEVLISIASDKGSAFYQVGDNWRYMVESDTLSGQEIKVTGENEIDVIILGRAKVCALRSRYSSCLDDISLCFKRAGPSTRYPTVQVLTIVKVYKSLLFQARLLILKN